MTGRARIEARIRGQATDSLPLMPITMMFAADHAGIPYRQYATDGEELARAQLSIAAAYDFDYVSAISDPAREASDLGAAVEWFDDQPPALRGDAALIGDKSMLAGLQLPDPERPGSRMIDRCVAVRALARGTAGELMVEGWIEGPCAMAADLRGLNTLMLDFADDPEFVAALMEFCVDMELRFAAAQVAAGAQLIGIGDAAASLVGPRVYDHFVLPWERRLVTEVKRLGALVRLHICGNTRKIVRGMGQIGSDIVDLDFLTPLAEARAAMGETQVLLGNLDPVRVLRDGTPDSIYTALDGCYKDAGSNYIAGAGCEVPRGTPAGNLRAMTRFARAHQ